MPGALEIRTAAADDLDACARLITGHEGGDTSEWRRRFIRYLADPDGCFLVAVNKDAVVGYGRAERQNKNPLQASPALPDGYYLSGIVVADEHRRTGIGLALCEARIAWVASRANEVWYFTNVRNRASRDLHRRAGFTEVQLFQSPHLNGGNGVLGRRPTEMSLH